MNRKVASIAILTGIAYHIPIMSEAIGQSYYSSYYPQGSSYSYYYSDHSYDQSPTVFPRRAYSQYQPSYRPYYGDRVVPPQPAVIYNQVPAQGQKFRLVQNGDRASAARTSEPEGRSTAQDRIGQTKGPDGLSPSSIPNQLTTMKRRLGEFLKQADTMPGRIKAVIDKTPADMQREVEAIAKDIDTMANTMAENGSMHAAVMELVSKATENKKNLPERTDIDDTDRTIALDLWAETLREATAALDTMKSLRARLLALGQRARQKKAGIAAIMQAGEYKDVAKSLTAWLSELEAAVREMHDAIDAISKAPGA